MNEKVLSQDEVDALLKGVELGDIETESASAPETEGARTFDLTSQDRVIRGRMPGLEMINERFSRFFRDSISSIIMKFIDIHIHTMELTKFSDFMKTIPLPSSINIFKMEPLKGNALFVIEAPMVFAFIEYFFGASSAKHVKSEGRYFTPIEQRIIKKVVTMGLKNLGEAWEGVFPIQPEHTGSEMNPQFVTIVTPTEVVIKIELHVEIEDFLGKIFFCIPYSMIEPIKDKLCSGIKGEKFDVDQRWVSLLKEMLSESYVNVTAELGKTELTVHDMMNLEVGYVINLGKAISDELLIKIEGIPKFTGTPGLSRGNQAIKITSIY